MRTGRPVTRIELSAEVAGVLESYTQRRKTAQALALRARIVLGCAAGLSNQAVAARERVTPQTVGKWRRRFAERGVDGLLDEPRPGVPRKIDDAKVESVIVQTLESQPPGATHWSTRSMARHSGISTSSVGRIWRAFGLQPHRAESFKLSQDPLFVDKVRDVVGLYLNPPDHALVLCVDEKSQIQALDRTQPLLPMRPGQIERRSHDYQRHGTTSLFAALDIATGRVIGRCYQRHRAVEFRKFLAAVEAAVPADFDIHLVLDNYATHKAPAGPHLAGRSPALSPALHPDQRVLAEPGRTLVRAACRQADQAWRSPQRPGIEGGHRRLHPGPQRQPETVHLDQDRRCHPSDRGAILLRHPRRPHPDLLNEFLIQDTSISRRV